MAASSSGTVIYDDSERYLRAMITAAVFALGVKAMVPGGNSRCGGAEPVFAGEGVGRV